ncbi:MAG: DUF4190 domain-containing protein [Phycisphaeraceae bacterium]|nr:DUF4190 domain-containing protein [Phycisphaeraceae bacterium]MCB9847196.1 DUF4190 domain-containing protein [Phycisphaeraceae bacterium]
MSGNPYIDEAGYLGDGPVRGSRTSALAVASLAVSLVCCVPYLGILSIVLGASSLLLIARANGRLTGRGAAIAGLIVGIMTTVIWGAIGAGIMQGWNFYTKQMIPVGEAAMQSVNTDDVAAMRATLNPVADGDLTDGQILVFMAACREEMGSVSGASRDFRTIGDSFVETIKRSNGNNRGGGHGQFDEEVAPIPIGIETARGRFFIWVIFDATTLKGPADRKIADVMVMQDGMNGFTLREDGPGRDMCDAMNMKGRTAAEAMQWREEERRKLQAPAEEDSGPAAQEPGSSDH